MEDRRSRWRAAVFSRGGVCRQLFIWLEQRIVRLPPIPAVADISASRLEPPLTTAELASTRTDICRRVHPAHFKNGELLQALQRYLLAGR